MLCRVKIFDYRLQFTPAKAKSVQKFAAQFSLLFLSVLRFYKFTLKHFFSWAGLLIVTTLLCCSDKNKTRDASNSVKFPP